MVLARPRERWMTKIRSKNSLYPHSHFNKQLVDAFRKPPRESNLNHKISESFNPVTQEYNRDEFVQQSTYKKLSKIEAWWDHSRHREEKQSCARAVAPRKATLRARTENRRSISGAGLGASDCSREISRHATQHGRGWQSRQRRVRPGWKMSGKPQDQSGTESNKNQITCLETAPAGVDSWWCTRH
jgi:hypothetical protein